MVENLILKWGNYNTDKEDRIKISMFTSIYGLLLNLLLVLFKVILFFTTSSVSILADAINNLVDSLSSIITLLGAKLSDLPPDKEHPYGHGRIEYISALLVAAFIFVTGFQFIKVSIDRIINPVAIKFDFLTVFIMVISVLVKLYMSFFYDKISKKIDSMPIKAQSKDSLADVFVTSVVVITIIFYQVTKIHIDGYVGVLVSLFILYSGYELISETFSELIGEVPTELIAEIENKIVNYDNILGVHDMLVVNFGPSKKYITLDVEIPYNMSLVDAHSLINTIEMDIKKEYDIDVSIHVDPIGLYNGAEKDVVNVMKDIIEEDPKLLSFHDIHIFDNTVRVDVIVDDKLIDKKSSVQTIKDEISEKIKSRLNKNSIITIDRSFD
ncbi:cobalt-zinc-cadmium resistance protein CzcD [Peptoniphilus sp. ING2-D1G]|nr:cobalt-zinc-cadmium resistance protein CzcD [Peptoniphilus sp. ING2-D1G]